MKENKMKLLLTLGHNSSAVLVKDSKVLCGYEEERLSGVKSDSSFPILSIDKILHYFPKARNEVKDIYISHWFWDFSLVENKYYRPKYLESNFRSAKIHSVDNNNTHHDLHAKSVWNFLDGDKSGLTIVADGFGNFGECLSIYIDGKLSHRSYEVSSSLGMMYQYAIRYLDMKEHQDEYKLLGYEQQVDFDDANNMGDLIYDTINTVTTDLLTKFSEPKKNMAKELATTWDKWFKIFKLVDNGEQDRPKIAYFVQTVLEGVMDNILKEYNIKNIKVSGGVFYNVKLNSMILEYSEKFEANPLAGDQGCALGFIDVRYDNLFWGKRELNNYIDTNNLYKYGYIEVMKGDMEFGPRALGNTSCIAYPSKKMVNIINTINGRDTVMPMAPIVTEDFAKEHFKHLDKVEKSKYFMIIAYEFIGVETKYLGALHKDKFKGIYTGRLQVVKDDSLLLELLNDNSGILINTSLNAHGQPILYDMIDYNIMKEIQFNV
jgi:predicted NodU family carbamoyl transferase